MAVGRKRLGIALLSSVLAVLASCSGGIGLLMGEGPMPDGGVGHSRLQDAAGLVSMSLALLFFLLCLRLCLAMAGRVSPSKSVLLVRLAAVGSVGIGLAMVVPGFMRFLDGGPEGLLLAGLGTVVGVRFALPLLATRESDFEES